MKSIIFIVPYFGKFRSDFSFWLRSVEDNPTVDFILFTDQVLSDIPDNVRCVKCDLAFIQQLAKKNVWPECRLEHPYKLCDYKTAYGELFCDYIKGYDFWGHCDVDQVFGNIRRFITDDILEQHDRIGVEGFFTLYRNTPEVNHHYWNLGEEFIKHAFTDQGIYGLDEWGPGGKGGGTSNWWIENRRDRLWMDHVFDSIEPYTYCFITKRAEQDGVKNVMFTYDSGTLTRHGLQNGQVVSDETLLAHVQKRSVQTETPAGNQFCIVPPGRYVAYKSNITKSFLILMNLRISIATLNNKIRNKINKLLIWKRH